MLQMGVIVEAVVYQLAPLVLEKLPFQQERVRPRGRTHRVRQKVAPVSDRQNIGGVDSTPLASPDILLH